MRYKEKVASNLDAVANHLGSLKNMVENNSITKDLLVSEMEKLVNRIEGISEMVGLEDTDFSNLKQGVQR